MFPLIQYELDQVERQEKLRSAELQRLVNLAMEGQPRRPGIISRWMAALKTLATLRVTAPIPDFDRPVVMAHESGTYRIR